jgi:hypothetical protein
MKKYRGFEFKQAVALTLRKICSDLGRPPVQIDWCAGIATASINQSGAVTLANVKDDAVLTDADLMRYVGFAVHELLHWTYTEFNAVYSASYEGQYVAQLHNALEDAWIEHKGIEASLTGNITALLTALIEGMVKEALIEVADWSNPAQYPFVLAVYARKHAKIKVPLALGLEPIFAEASNRLNACNDSWGTLEVAKWVFAQLNQIEPPSPPTNPRPTDKRGEDGKPDGNPDGNPDGKSDGKPDGKSDGKPEDGNEDVSGDPSGGATGEDQQGGKPTPPADPAKRPTDAKGKTVEAREVEPTTKAPEGTGSGGSFHTGIVKRNAYHALPDSNRIFPIDF